MNKVLVTRRIPQPALDLLSASEDVDLVVSPFDRKMTDQELLEMSEGCTAVLSMLVDKIDRDFLQARPNVKIVANYAVGFDNLDLEAAKELGVTMTNTPDVLTDATADLAMALLLCLTRRMLEGDAYVRRGDFTGTSPMFMLGTDLKDKIMGIYGMGRIGIAVAKRAKAFGMKIIYSKRTPDPKAEEELNAKYVSFDKLLEQSDVISLNAPLTDQTRGVFNLSVFERMKKTAYLINTARGPLVKEDDLVKALEQNMIQGAGLDVYEFEPKVHDKLLPMKNVALSPHQGSATWETRTEIGMVAARNILDFLQGKEPPNRLV